MKIVLIFFWKLTIVSNDIKVMGRSFHVLRAPTEKTQLPRLSFVSGTENSCEMDHLTIIMPVQFGLRFTGNIGIHK